MTDELREFINGIMFFGWAFALLAVAFTFLKWVLKI